MNYKKIYRRMAIIGMAGFLNGSADAESGICIVR